MERLFKGALSVRRDRDWYVPLRFTEKQLESYRKTEALRIRSMSPAGVKLEFYTSATSISFDYKITGRARSWAAFDLLEDGVLKDSFLVWEDNGHVKIPLSGNEKVKIEIYLPHLVEISLRNIEANAILYPVKKKDMFWLCLGDSITQGMDAVHPSTTYPVRAAIALNAEVLNSGVGGGVFCADNLDDIGYEPNLITIALGCNDWGHAKDKKDFTENIRAYLEKLSSLYKCQKIYGILPIWRSDANTVRSGMTFEEMRSIIFVEYGKYPRIKIIDGMHLLPADKCFYGDAGELKAHPNAEGFWHYAKNLLYILNK